jgi:hypothetical protein
MIQVWMGPESVSRVEQRISSGLSAGDVTG